ncbi:MAG TPA: transposase [Dehalococcoidia bacterium]|nr:transposase [Dehalococcoidia bacterium]
MSHPVSYHRTREVTVGLGPVEVLAPPEVAPQGFHSQVVQRYQRASQTTQRLFARLYLEGLATGDFEPVFRELLGETTVLLANTVVRLNAYGSGIKDHWGQEYQDWRRRPLGEHRYAYIWVDGIYLAAGSEKGKTVLRCVLGAREDGERNTSVAGTSGCSTSRPSRPSACNLRPEGACGR